jgi:hypothetical protein
MSTLAKQVSCLAFVSMALSPPCHAMVWDANADFNNASTGNPNGVWTYGYDAQSAPGYQLKPFDTFSIGTLTAWTDATHVSLGAPTFARNDSRSFVNGLPPGQIALHPGPDGNGDAAILRFTAPADGVYAVTAQFFAGDSGETDAWLIKNDEAATPFASLGVTSVNPSFASRAIQLAAGETLDFVVGNHGDFFFDTTPLSVQIASVPEPTTALMLLVGSMLVAGVSRRVR